MTNSNTVWSRFTKWLHNFRSYHRTLNQLGSLSDRELADIGLERNSIKNVALAVYRSNTDITLTDWSYIDAHSNSGPGPYDKMYLNPFASFTFNNREMRII